MTDIQRMVLLGIKDDDFDKVKKLLDDNEVDFWVNNPILGISKMTGTDLLKK